MLTTRARELGAWILLLPVTGAGSRRGVDGPTLVQACLTAADGDVLPVAVPHHGDHAREAALRLRVAAAYGATHVPASAAALTPDLTASNSILVDLPDVALDLRSGTWELAAKVPVEDRALDGPGQTDRLVGAARSSW